jgi:undecaprenyl-phosphate galactose phosphotransferase
MFDLQPKTVSPAALESYSQALPGGKLPEASQVDAPPDWLLLDDLSARVRAVTARPVYEFTKRVFDVGFALAFLIAALPLIVTAILFICITSPGPLFFCQRRVGRNGRLFLCYKFRTMRTDAEKVLAENIDLKRQYERTWKLEDDPRVTPVGRWLRKLSVDEIPQMINVLKGDMSVVGPRPVQERELVTRFGRLGPVITAVKPGLTSLWVLAGRSKLNYDSRVALELEYVLRRGFVFDCTLVFKTVIPVLLRRGAV